MRRKIHRAPMAVASALLLGVFATSCSTEDPTDSTSGTDESSETSESPDASESPEEGGEQEWFDQAVYDEQFEQRSATFEGDPETPWLQYIDGEMTDTADYKSNKAGKACFANASISNPWRQTGWITMNQQLEDL
ncbi:MAG TPA: hypothetical protein VK903_12345, partial [Propionicimonas sp.]|nr:hypothetical protein [Propionicimonas sp.]